jgi:hypothetical protein
MANPFSPMFTGPSIWHRLGGPFLNLEHGLVGGLQRWSNNSSEPEHDGGQNVALAVPTGLFLPLLCPTLSAFTIHDYGE